LGKAAGKGAMRRALRDAAQPTADYAKKLAPNDPRTGDGDLQSTIAVSPKLSPRQARAHKKMFRNDKSAVEMFVGAGPVPQAHLQEFGTKQHGPQPFMRPAWMATQSEVLSELKKNLRSEIDRAIARAVRKAARQAARSSG
jgi:HK97 gp10 family phage protein